MKNEKEIQDRVNELNVEINNWTKERWKQGNSHEYNVHCAEVITGFQGERDALKWVLK